MLIDEIQRRYFYYTLRTPFQNINFELEKREKDAELKRKIEEKLFLTEELKPLLQERHLVLFRQVSTPLHETLEVIKQASHLGIKVALLEYQSDLFVSSGNEYKRSLGKLPIYEFTDKAGNDIFHYHTVVDFNKYVGKQLCDVKTKKGESLIDFHHSLFDFLVTDNSNITIIDATKWFSSFPGGSVEYYKYFFEFFLCHNVLAEIFWGHKHTQSFVKNVVYPAFKCVKKKWRYQPLIYNYQPRHEQQRLYWDCYPNKVDEFLAQKGYI